MIEVRRQRMRRELQKQQCLAFRRSERLKLLASSPHELILLNERIEAEALDPSSTALLAELCRVIEVFQHDDNVFILLSNYLADHPAQASYFFECLTRHPQPFLTYLQVLSQLSRSIYTEAHLGSLASALEVALQPSPPCQDLPNYQYAMLELGVRLTMLDLTCLKRDDQLHAHPPQAQRSHCEELDFTHPATPSLPSPDSDESVSPCSSTPFPKPSSTSERGWEASIDPDEGASDPFCGTQIDKAQTTILDRLCRLILHLFDPKSCPTLNKYMQERLWFIVCCFVDNCVVSERLFELLGALAPIVLQDDSDHREEALIEVNASLDLNEGLFSEHVMTGALAQALGQALSFANVPRRLVLQSAQKLLKLSRSSIRLFLESRFHELVAECAEDALESLNFEMGVETLLTMEVIFAQIEEEGMTDIVKVIKRLEFFRFSRSLERALQCPDEAVSAVADRMVDAFYSEDEGLF